MNRRQKMQVVLEASWVRRWHTMPENGATETVGHHSFQVASFIAVFCPEVTTQLLLAALEHDRHERWSGDIPSPGRRAVPEGQSYEDIMQDRLDRLVDGDYAMRHELEPWEQMWLKLADAACAFYWCCHQQRLGNSHVTNAYFGCLEGVKKIAQEGVDAGLWDASLGPDVLVVGNAGRLPEGITKLEELTRD